MKKYTKEEIESYAQTLFETYFHFDKIEALLSSVNIMNLPIDNNLMLELESLKSRSKRIRKLFDKSQGENSAEIGEKFDKLNELLKEHMQITVTV